MVRNVDRERVTVAQLAGVAAAVSHMRRLTTEQGLAEVDAVLLQVGVRPGTPAAVQLLNRAAGPYRRSSGEGPSWWHPEAVEFLIVAGADPA